MAGIQGLKAKEKKTYATTALENSEKEKKAIALKIEQERKNNEMQANMAALYQNNPLVDNGVADLQAKPSLEVSQPSDPSPSDSQPSDLSPSDSEPSKVVVEVEKVEKPPVRTNSTSKNSAKGVAYFNERNMVEFSEAFQIKQAKRQDFKPFSFSAPQDIALEVKTRAMRDNISMCELNNLLFVLYCEKGLPKELLDRYKKSTTTK